MSKGYYIIVWRCLPYRQIVTSELVWLVLALTLEHVTSLYVWCLSRCRKEWGESALGWGARSADCGRGVGKQWTKKKAFSRIFTADSKSFIHVTHIAAMHIIFTRIGCTLFTCDMYMCRLRHINDPVLSSLKMEGIRLLSCIEYTIVRKCYKKTLFWRVRLISVAIITQYCFIFRIVVELLVSPSTMQTVIRSSREVPNFYPISVKLNVLDTLQYNLSQWPTWCTYFNTFITILYMYMFRAISCSSSGGQIVLKPHLVSSLSVSDRPVHRTITYWQWRYQMLH
jgi:hypothetical protein